MFEKMQRESEGSAWIKDGKIMTEGNFILDDTSRRLLESGIVSAIGKLTVTPSRPRSSASSAQ